MKDVPSEPQIDLEASSRDEHDKQRLVAPADSDKLDVDKLSESCRIERAPRAQTPEREMLRQPWMLD